MPAKTIVNPVRRRRRAAAPAGARLDVALSAGAARASRPPLRSRRARPTRPRCRAKRRPRPRCGSPKPRRAASRRRMPDALIIGSDQVADCDGRRDRQAGRSRARRRAARARCPGRTVVFHTGLALLDAASGRCRTALVDVAQHFPRPRERRDRGVPAPRAALRLRGQREVRGARHRALRARSRATIRRR